MKYQGTTFHARCIVVELMAGEAYNVTNKRRTPAKNTGTNLPLFPRKLRTLAMLAAIRMQGSKLTTVFRRGSEHTSTFAGQNVGITSPQQ